MPHPKARLTGMVLAKPMPWIIGQNARLSWQGIYFHGLASAHLICGHRTNNSLLSYFSLDCWSAHHLTKSSEHSIFPTPDHAGTQAASCSSRGNKCISNETRLAKRNANEPQKSGFVSDKCPADLWTRLTRSLRKHVKILFWRDWKHAPLVCLGIFSNTLPRAVP